MIEWLNENLQYVFLGAIAYNTLAIHLRVEQIARTIYKVEIIHGEDADDGESTRTVLE